MKDERNYLSMTNDIIASLKEMTYKLNSSYELNKLYVGKVMAYDDEGATEKIKVLVYGVFDNVPVDDLPWAEVLADPYSGSGQGGLSESLTLVGGERVLGFFLDGEDAQHTTRLQVQLGQGAQEVQKGLKGLQPRSFAGYVTPRAFIKA